MHKLKQQNYSKETLNESFCKGIKDLDKKRESQFLIIEDRIYPNIVNENHKTSIVILTYNKLEFTIRCIESIREFTRTGTYEIIVVDNNSSDDTQNWLTKQCDIKTIFNKENVGFPKGCNQGIEVAEGNSILLLNNDTIVTHNWLDQLVYALYSSSEIGAVGPVTNYSSYYQTIQVPYNDNINEMHHFAKSFNIQDPTLWEQRLKLIGFCMLIKKEVIDEVGYLDERFTPGNFEDDDLSYRIIKAGYKLFLCKDTFIHHYGSVSFGQENVKFNKLLQANAKKFKDKWGLDSQYSSFIRYEILNLMDEHDRDIDLKVLEVGCACGGTLLEIKNKYKNAELYGIEFNENSASIASSFANVKAVDAEKPMTYPEHYFDYIILADVLEHLNNPWAVLENLKKHLKNNGKILASIPNVMHYSVLKNTINGHWTYTDSGLLDRTHLRFFTLSEIIKMFEKSHLRPVTINANVVPIPEEDEIWIKTFSSLSGNLISEQFRAYQYLVKAQKETKLEELIKKMQNESIQYDCALEILAYCKKEQISEAEILKVVEEVANDKVGSLHLLANVFYNNHMIDYCLSFLETAFFKNENNVDTLFNLGYLLYDIGEKVLALDYLLKIKQPDEEIVKLINQIKKELK